MHDLRKPILYTLAMLLPLNFFWSFNDKVLATMSSEVIDGAIEMVKGSARSMGMEVIN